MCKARAVLLVALAALLSLAPARADEIRLKSGAHLRGKIRGRIPEGTVVQLDGGGFEVIDDYDIEKIVSDQPQDTTPTRVTVAPERPRYPRSQPGLYVVTATGLVAVTATAGPSTRGPWGSGGDLQAIASSLTADPMGPTPERIAEREAEARQKAAVREYMAARRAEYEGGSTGGSAGGAGPLADAAATSASTYRTWPTEGSPSTGAPLPASAGMQRVRGLTPGYSVEVPEDWTLVIGTDVGQMGRAIEARLRAQPQWTAPPDLLALDLRTGWRVFVFFGPAVPRPLGPADVAATLERPRADIVGQSRHIVSAEIRAVGAVSAIRAELMDDTDAGRRNNMRSVLWIVPGRFGSYGVCWTMDEQTTPGVYASFRDDVERRMQSFEGAVQPATPSLLRRIDALDVIGIISLPIVIAVLVWRRGR